MKVIQLRSITKVLSTFKSFWWKKYTVAFLLNARIVEPEEQSLLGNGYVTRKNGLTVGSGVFYAIRPDNYVIQQQNCGRGVFCWFHAATV
jgi:hypothetical protein